MKFGQTEIPENLFKLARERMRQAGTFTPDDVRVHLAKHAQDDLAAVGGIGVNGGIIADRVTRSCLRELRAAGEVSPVKRGTWALTGSGAA